MKKILKQRKYQVGLLLLLSVLSFSNPAFAAGVSVPWLSEAINALKQLLLIVGGGIGGLGVINLIEAFQNENPQAKTQGIKQLATGLALVIIAKGSLIASIFNF